MSAVQKLSRFQVRLLQHARRRRRLGSLACPRVPVPSSYRSLSGALGNQAPASGAKTWNESRWVCQRIDIHVIMTRIWLELQFRNEVNVVMVAGALTLPQGSTLASCVGYQMTAGSIPSHTTHTHTHAHKPSFVSCCAFSTGHQQHWPISPYSNWTQQQAAQKV